MRISELVSECYAPPTGMPTITARDEEILLDKTPLTAGQLLKLSEIFVNGRFTSERKVRARLQKLMTGPVRQARYGGLAGRIGSPSYYFLSPLGFRMLHGNDVRPQSKYAFKEIGDGRQPHTYAIAEFVIQTLRSANHFAIPVIDFYRENALKLQVGWERLLQDCAFTLESDGTQFRFMVEIDCGSEPILSVRSVHAWQRKIELYEDYAEQSEDRFPTSFLMLKNSPISTLSEPRNVLEHLCNEFEPTHRCMRLFCFRLLGSQAQRRRKESPKTREERTATGVVSCPSEYLLAVLRPESIID